MTVKGPQQHTQPETISIHQYLACSWTCLDIQRNIAGQRLRVARRIHQQPPVIPSDLKVAAPERALFGLQSACHMSARQQGDAGLSTVVSLAARRMVHNAQPTSLACISSPPC